MIYDPTVNKKNQTHIKIHCTKYYRRIIRNRRLVKHKRRIRHRSKGMGIKILLPIQTLLTLVLDR